MATREPDDRVALRALVDRYAQIVDHRDYAAAGELWAADAELVGRDFHVVGRDRIVRGLRTIERFSATFHAVHGQVVELAGARATGETTCTAQHFFERDEQPRRLDWGIRYGDAYVRESGVWRFARRELRIVWEHEVAMDVPAG